MSLNSPVYEFPGNIRYIQFLYPWNIWYFSPGLGKSILKYFKII